MPATEKNLSNKNEIEGLETEYHFDYTKARTNRFAARTAGHSSPALAVDLDIFGAKEIRDILKSKAHCLQAGFSPNHVIIKTLDDIREHYILKVGLPTYLSQMLGGLATVQTQHCTFYKEDGRPIKMHLNGHHNQAVQRFIAGQFRKNELQFRVEVRQETNPRRTEVRYL